MKKIVSTQWLNENLDNPNLILLDASITNRADGLTQNTSELTIPRARYFDLKHAFSDKSSVFPNTVPSAAQFEFECQKLGINQNSQIVVFDNQGIYSSPRVWWLFNIMGHNHIAVLDGGLPRWMDQGFQTIKKHQSTYAIGDFKASFNSEFVITYDKVKRNSVDMKFLIADARSNGRFNGTDQEPRVHLKSGKIPNSINIHYQDVLKDGAFKTKEALHELFTKKCKSDKELVFSCGSGLTACIIMLASQIGYKDFKKVYDGSWTEWAELNNLKKTL